MDGVRDAVRAFAWLLVCGCASEPLSDAVLCETMGGDLVITEVHANPDGPDGQDEFIELYNPGDTMLQLAGLSLASSRGDGTGVSEHRFGEGEIPPGGYYVLGNTEPETRPPHVDYGYGATLGSLRNSDARLTLSCGDRLIDGVEYASTRDGRSLGFDGELEPDAEQNDDMDRWCLAPEGASEAFTGNFGSPGAPNDPCVKSPINLPCVDDFGDMALPPAPGALRITEWMANPAGPDGELEWVEVLLAAHADLAGMRLGTSDDALGPVVFESCFPVDAGSRIVFGASPGAAPRVDADLGITLGNTGPRSIVVALEDTVFDRVDYVDAREGLAQQVDAAGDSCDVEAAPDNEYALGNFGSPGVSNPSCPEILEPGMCFDQGAARAIRPPRPTDVRISEWMANPAQVENREGEWVELEFLTSADLNGLAWSDLSSESVPLESTSCLPVDAGSRVVFARSVDPAQNGGLPVEAYPLGISLNNINESIAVSVGGETLDSVSYVSSRPGVATQRDDSGAVCDAVTPYGAGDLGSPGQPNRVCP